jgi:hypothetical protein
MKTPPATKGRAFERKNHADIEAHGIKCRLHGQWESHDLTLTLNDEPHLIECKDCKQLSLGAIEKELKKGNYAVIHKRFRGPRRITMDFHDWLELLITAQYGAYPAIEVLDSKTTEVAYLKHGEPIPEGWVRHDGLDETHHGEYSTLITRAAE